MASNSKSQQNAGTTGGGEIQLHLQAMLYVLRSQDTLKMAVRLENQIDIDHTRYMAIISTVGRQDNAESAILGIDYGPTKTTLGLVLPIYGNTRISLNGDGGIVLQCVGIEHVFKPVSVQAMWSAYQCLHKEHDISRSPNLPYHSGGMTHAWVQYYESNINSPEAFLAEWHHTFVDDRGLHVDSLERHQDKSSDRVTAEREIRFKLRNIMQTVDLDEVTSKDVSYFI